MSFFFTYATTAKASPLCGEINKQLDELFALLQCAFRSAAPYLDGHINKKANDLHVGNPILCQHLSILCSLSLSPNYPLQSAKEFCYG
jgi:hypothetical protein